MQAEFGQKIYSVTCALIDFASERSECDQGEIDQRRWLQNWSAPTRGPVSPERELWRRIMRSQSSSEVPLVRATKRKQRGQKYI